MTSHNRTPSVASTLTDLSESVNNASDRSSSSVSSNVSVTSDDFKLKVNELIASQALPISRLEIRARSFIDDLKNGGEYNSPLYGGSKIRKEVKLHRVLEAMLHYSFECGKEVGRSPDRIEKKLAYLQSLGTTWLSHLLFVFKANSSHRLQQNPSPSSISTPTVNETAGHLDEGAHDERADYFRHNVLKRDGYRCVVTGRYDVQHPQVPQDQFEVDLEAGHILRRAIAVFKGPNNNSDEYISALTTFDILRHYADLPIKSIEDIANVIDDPSNGLALQKDVHTGFDKFRWSLKETATPNQYTTFIYEKGHGFLQAEPQTVTFTDKSCAFDEPSPRPHKRLRPNITGISLPNPLFVRIHHAIAGVLHMSGAGECIDRALDKAGKGATGVLFTGADFAHLGLAEDLVGAMS